MAGAAAVHAAGAPALFAAEDAAIRIGLIGCGGRGTGAVLDALGAATKVIYPSAGYHTEDVAAGAADRPQEASRSSPWPTCSPTAWRALRGELAKLGIDDSAGTRFTGFDAYKQLLAVPEINYVILATPPHFRPHAPEGGHRGRQARVHGEARARSTCPA